MQHHLLQAKKINWLPLKNRRTQKETTMSAINLNGLKFRYRFNEAWILGISIHINWFNCKKKTLAKKHVGCVWIETTSKKTVVFKKR